jgi:hypothetical protein
MSDARFEDGAERPLHLVARDAEDLKIVSTLVQDAVFPITEMAWDRRKRRFALLLNRFRWEDREAAQRSGRGVERVQSVLVVQDVLAVKSQGIDREARDMVLSLLSLDFQPGAEGAGVLTLVLAGDGAVALEVEALDLALNDVTRPYLAPSGKVPKHPE